MKRTVKSKRNMKKKDVVYRSMMDLTPFMIKISNSASIFTATTQYLGRYNQMHPIFGLTGGTNTGIGGLYSWVSTASVSNSTGIYFSFLPIKLKLDFWVTNLETASQIRCNIIEIPYNLTSTTSSNYAIDLTTQSARSVVCGVAISGTSNKQIKLSSKIARINGLNDSQYKADSSWVQTRNGVGSKFSSYYFQFIRSDGQNFVNGVDINYTIEYYCQPIQRNAVLID
jgi:hypothetical protein